MIEMLMYSIITGIICGFITTIWIKSIIIARIEEDDEEEDIESNIIPGRLETVEGRIFLYNRETDEFLAVGDTWEELNKKATQRFPNKFFDVPKKEIERAIEYSELK
jgi:hypothetical protein